MLLAITDTISIGELQEAFSEHFPHLTICFYHHHHHWKTPPPDSELVAPDIKVEVLRAKHEPGILEIKSWYKTGRVERDLKKQFGLNARIFRWENGQWTLSENGALLTAQEGEKI